MTTGPAMNLARLAALLDAWGADPARWPAHEREGALALAREDGAAAAMLREAAALDRVTAQAGHERASGALLARVLTDAEPRGLRGIARALWPSGPLWRPATVLAGAAALGIVLGAFVVPGSNADDGLWADEEAQIIVAGGDYLAGGDL